MATAVGICSNALLMLGAQPIASFLDGTDRATLAANLWPDVRAALLRSHNWNCLAARVTLAADAAPPAFDWAYQYSLPADWLRTLSVGQAGYEPEYQVEGRKILCDESPLYLRYIRDDAEGNWDALLTQAAILSMQAAMAYGITQSASVRDSALAQLERFLKQARAIDGQDGTPETLGDFALLAGRYTNRAW